MNKEKKINEFLNKENPTNKDILEVAEILTEETNPVATSDKHNFTAPLQLACANNDFRPALYCVHFLNGYAYASDGHILAKQSLELHTILNPEKLNGKGINKDSFKQILQFKIVEAHDDHILCIDEGRRAKFMYFKGAAAPNFEAVIPTGETLPVHYFGINPKYLTVAGKILHGSNNGVKMTFKGNNKACILTTEEYKEEQLVLIMPMILEPVLF